MRRPSVFLQNVPSSIPVIPLLAADLPSQTTKYTYVAS